MGDELVSQDEVEKLLRELNAGGAGGAPKPPAAATPASPPAAAAVTGMSADAGVAFDQNDIDALFRKAESAIQSIDTPVAPPPPNVSPFKLPEFGGAPAAVESATLELIRDVELDLRIELGRTHMYLEDVLKLAKGAVVPLDKMAGDPVDIFVNGRLIARGEVLVLNDNFCVRVAELVAGDHAAGAA